MLYGDIYRCAKFYSFKVFFMLEIHLEKNICFRRKSWAKGRKEGRKKVDSPCFISVFIIIEFYMCTPLERGIIKDVRGKIHEINHEIREV